MCKGFCFVLRLLCLFCEVLWFALFFIAKSFVFASGLDFFGKEFCLGIFFKVLSFFLQSFFCFAMGFLLFCCFAKCCFFFFAWVFVHFCKCSFLARDSTFFAIFLQYYFLLRGATFFWYSVFLKKWNFQEVLCLFLPVAFCFFAMFFFFFCFFLKVFFSSDGFFFFCIFFAFFFALDSVVFFFARGCFFFASGFVFFFCCKRFCVFVQVIFFLQGVLCFCASEFCVSVQRVFFCVFFFCRRFGVFVSRSFFFQKKGFVFIFGRRVVLISNGWFSFQRFSFFQRVVSFKSFFFQRGVFQEFFCHRCFFFVFFCRGFSFKCFFKEGIFLGFFDWFLCQEKINFKKREDFKKRAFLTKVLV